MSRPASLLLSIAALALCSVAALGQNSAPPAKPGPEVQKMSAFIGKWTSTGDMKSSPMGPGGKITGADDCEWTAGGFAVLCHGSSSMPGMKSTDVALISYDTEAKNYIYSEADSTGTVGVFRGSLDGDMWTWTADAPMNGQMMKQRFTMKFSSKDAFDFKFEIGANDASMSTVMDGKEKRATTAAKPAGTKPSPE